ncbi:hypothetical protein [Kitasatospora paracochleata]|uniref:Anti-sigma factor n=1 Tax=Kitasatospora paracochleata TaxID=58354 RepID=A0ABT1JA07_9ACTN|nr:hypothetical protein [Kitasatospora paracochleata]MCP2314044.1 hypothetical protein [Kitasatospora paracochleata]
MTREEYDAWQAELAEMNAAYEEADQAEYEAFMDELDARDLRAWADTVLGRTAVGGAELEQRHVLDEAARPDLVEAFRRFVAAV